MEEVTTIIMEEEDHSSHSFIIMSLIVLVQHLPSYSGETLRSPFATRLGAPRGGDVVDNVGTTVEYLNLSSLLRDSNDECRGAQHCHSIAVYPAVPPP